MGRRWRCSCAAMCVPCAVCREPSRHDRIWESRSASASESLREVRVKRDGERRAHQQRRELAWQSNEEWSSRSDDLKWGWRPLIPGNLWIDGRCAVSVRICLNKHSDVNKIIVRPSVLCSPSFHRHHLPRRCRRAILSRCRRVVLALPGLIPPPKNGRPHLPCPLRSRRIRSQIPYPYPFPPRTHSLLKTSSHPHRPHR